jgi:hypothetical protein
MQETRLWAEVGIWQAGHPELMVRRTELWNGALLEGPFVLHEVPLALPDGFDEKHGDLFRLSWEPALKELGYRMAPGENHHYTHNSVKFRVEALA